jgi:multimeric flavodoxin WrbA
MKTMIFTSSPNQDGLTAACGYAAKLGATQAKSEVILINLNNNNIGNCKSCGNGWGTCKDLHECQVLDEFQALHTSMKEIDVFIFVTPVYWGEMSESMKAFTDRLRRCEAWKKEANLFWSKPVICVAAAGGSGNGTLSCLTSMERFVMHVGATKFDFISITQKTREFKLDTIINSAKKMILDHQ